MSFERVRWPADRVARHGPTSKPREGVPTVTLRSSNPEVISMLVEIDLEKNDKTAKLYQQEARKVLWKVATRRYTEFDELQDHLHGHAVEADSEGMEILQTTIDGFDISITYVPPCFYRAIEAWYCTVHDRG